jgi:hypothetical protein
MPKSRKRLEQFLKDLLEPMDRNERRHWGAVYILGLLLNGERKSSEPLADRSEEGNVQALQQFVGQSPWDCLPLWERLGKRMIAELEPDPVWFVDDTGLRRQNSSTTSWVASDELLSTTSTSHSTEFGSSEAATLSSACDRHADRLEVHRMTPKRPMTQT